MSNIAGGTTLTTSLVQTGDLTGNLVLQTNGNTTALTLTTTQNALFANTISAAGNITGSNILTAGSISATGAITTGGDHSLIGNIVDTGNLWINTTANGNITLNPNGTGQSFVTTG